MIGYILNNHMQDKLGFFFGSGIVKLCPRCEVTTRSDWLSEVVTRIYKQAIYFPCQCWCWLSYNNYSPIIPGKVLPLIYLSITSYHKSIVTAQWLIITQTWGHMGWLTVSQVNSRPHIFRNQYQQTDLIKTSIREFFLLMSHYVLWIRYYWYMINIWVYNFGTCSHISEWLIKFIGFFTTQRPIWAG